MAQGNTGQPTTLTNAHILVGDSSNIAQDVAVSGDITITNAGVTTIKTDVALAGAPTAATAAVATNTTQIATTAFVIANSVTQPHGASVDNTIPRMDGTGGATIQLSNVVITDLDELYLYRTYEISETTTARTLASATDMNATIRTTNSSITTITLPNSLPVGFKCRIIQGGTGQVQLSAASGATIQNRLGYTATRDQYSVCDLEVIANSGGSAAIYTWSGDTYVASTAFSSPILASLQQVSITIAAGATSNTATITAVASGKAYCHWQGVTSQITTFNGATCMVDVTLTNTTTVTATRNTSDASNSITVNCTVVEFASAAIQNIQQGTITMTAAASNTATITAVVTANSIVHYNGATCTDTTASFSINMNKLVLTNTTTVTATRVTATNNLTARFVVIEFAAGVLNQAVQSITAAANTTALSAALTAFDPRYTMAFYGGFSWNTATNTDSGGLPCISSAGPANYALITGYVSAITYNPSWQIVEFTSTAINRITRNRITIAATTTSNTSAISSTNTVNTAKTLINFSGFTSGAALSTFRDAAMKVTLTDANTITATKNTSQATIAGHAYYEMVEFQ